jgi:hypothetical protein
MGIAFLLNCRSGGAIGRHWRFGESGLPALGKLVNIPTERWPTDLGSIRTICELGSLEQTMQPG